MLRGEVLASNPTYDLIPWMELDFRNDVSLHSRALSMATPCHGKVCYFVFTALNEPVGGTPQAQREL